MVDDVKQLEKRKPPPPPPSPPPPPQQQQHKKNNRNNKTINYPSFTQVAEKIRLMLRMERTSEKKDGELSDAQFHVRVMAAIVLAVEVALLMHRLCQEHLNTVLFPRFPIV